MNASIARGAAADAAHIRIATWLLACCALVFAMVALGGVTRLTRSGLSIVEWQPLIGALPPFSESDWLELFEKYKNTPEYLQVNTGMTLEGFKGIFWLEYFHRLLGRVIGIVFFVPFAWFIFRRMIGLRLGLQLGGIFVLGALQGFMGWYMVKSGLIHEPRVSHFRLTAHLALAFGIYAAMLWTALDLMAPRKALTDSPAVRRLRLWMHWITGLVVMMVLTGGFVAGIRAGLAYNTFPLMNGHIVPPEIFMLEPWYSNFFNNMATVQFNHRLFAWALMFAVPVVWWRARHASLPSRAVMLFHVLLATLAVQVTLGITTLLYAVPVALGTAHQSGALAVFTVALLLNHELKGSPGRSREP